MLILYVRIRGVKAKTLGYQGETLAAHFLQNKGYEILRNNFTVRGGEIDLVARNSNVLIFVEVKTRTGESFGHGDESMDRFKRMRMRRAIARYLNETEKNGEGDYRVDLIEIELAPDTQTLKNITHLEDIEL